MAKQLEHLKQVAVGVYAPNEGTICDVFTYCFFVLRRNDDDTVASAYVVAHICAVLLLLLSLFFFLPVSFLLYTQAVNFATG